MSYRVQCSACGKVMTLEDDAAGEMLVCIACGARLQAPPPPIVQAAEAPADAEGTQVPAAAVRAAVPTKPRAGSSRATTMLTAVAVSFAIVAVGALVVVAVLANRDRDGRTPGDRSVTSSEMRQHADLLKLKSEAEALAIEGKLAEAHEKYRQLQELAVGRDIKDALLWDVLERAKVDQDNIYTILLRKQAPLPENDSTTGPSSYASAEDGSSADAAEPPADTRQAGTQDGPRADATVDDDPAATQEVAASQPNMPTLVAQIIPADTVTDEQIEEAMKRGVDFLLAQFRDGQIVAMPDMDGVKHEGMNALCVYALLTAGQTMNDERLQVRGESMKKLIETMKSHDFKTRRGAQQPITYARSLRAAALAVFNRQEDRKVLKDDVDWLVAAAVNGAYTYDDQFTRGATAAREHRQASPSSGNLGEGRGEGLRTDISGSRSEVSDFRSYLALAAWTDDPAASPFRPAGLWYDDGSVQMVPMHGIHDPRTGRELYVPHVPLPRNTPTPLQGYPQRQRTAQPPRGGRPQQGTGIPPGWYDRNRTPLDNPDEMPRRGEESLSGPFPWDNSNSQYGLLGVWSGAEVGVEVPVRYWKDVEQHWTQTQLKSGEWGYLAQDRAGAYAMTCGGLASLFVTHDWLAAPMVKGSVGREPLTPPLALGLAWLERSDNCLKTPNPKTHYVGYDLYGLERVALASGFKYFGKHDWYRELSANALGTQWPTGAWGRAPDGADALVDTAYTLLFLARGRYPILMNKLRFEKSDVTRLDDKPQSGYWANRPRDLANLTRFASRQLEKGLNWQAVSTEAPWHDWLDAPVLYIASHQAPALEDAEYEKIRQFVEAGGLVFTHADNGAGAFNRWVPKLVEKVMPGGKLEDLPQDHVLYELNYKIKTPKPPLRGVSNGSRMLLVHAPEDLASSWQQRGERAAGDAFRLGLNIALYAAGKTDFRNRLSSPYVPEPKSEPRGTVQIARVKYEGNWDPEPGAWARFARTFQWQTAFVAKVKPVDFAGLKDGGVEVAHLTGNAAVKFTDADAAAVRAFVEGGGTLLIDACGGSARFFESVRDDLLAKAFTGTAPEALPKDHPVFKPAGEAEAVAARARPYAVERYPTGVPELKVLSVGRGHVIVSELDLTSGLLGTNTWGIAGYDPKTSQTLVRNLLLWAHGDVQ